MITCTLQARMGNQMYQIAATIGTALKYNVPYSIPKNTLNDMFPVYFDQLPCMPLSRKITSFHEQKNEYYPIKYDGGTLKLTGYFQSYKYFDHCLPQVIKAFGLNYNPASGKGFVSIHVRRGDYLALPDFPVLPLYYYYLAIDHFRYKGYTDFKVFSDDMHWCRMNINSNIFQNCRFQYSVGASEKEDMESMSSCEHNIVANSSYSIWAAMLNQNPDKIVISPDTMFKNANKDMIPKTWIILKTE